MAGVPIVSRSVCLFTTRLASWLALATAVAALGTTGCSEPRSPEEQLVAKLVKEPVMRVSEIGGTAGWGMPNALAIARQHRGSGIDLMAAYNHASGKKQARLSLAYMLLLLADEQYLAYAKGHVDSLESVGEFHIWRIVLTNQECPLEQEYRHAMVTVLEQVQQPYTELAVAAEQRRSGSVSGAVRTLLPIMEGNSWWSANAYSALKEMSASDPDVLLSFLEHPSREGLSIAVVLADTDQHRERAIAYLRTLRASEDSELSMSAVAELRWIESEKDFE